MHVDSACTGNAVNLQRHVATVPPETSFAYLGGTVTKMPNLSVESDRRIHSRWTSFRRYTQALYDHPKASLLRPKSRMMESEGRNVTRRSVTCGVNYTYWGNLFPGRI